MLALLLLIAAGGEADVLATHLARTRAEMPCIRPATPAEVVVCGAREKDRRYRVPFVTTDARDSVPTERARLLEPKIAGCGRVGGFYTDCGMVGMTMSTGDGRPVQIKPRKLAD
jgi:hypothetical protein